MPNAVIAGASETFTVTALSPNGGIDTSYLGTVQFSSTDSQAVLPASYTFTGADAGTHTFTVTFKTAGTQSIVATDTANGAIIGTEDNIIVRAAAASSLKVTGFPTSETAGTPQTFTVAAYDAYGNVATGYTGTVHFTSSDGQAILPANVTITPEDQGSLTVSATLQTAGTQSITATDINTSSFTGTESGIVVQAAAAKTLTIAGLPTSDTAGAVEAFTVTAYDVYGNVATGYVGTVEFTSTDSQAVMPAPYAFTTSDDGKHTFTATLKTSGTQNLNVTDTNTSSLTATESGIVVRAAAAQSLKVAGFPTSDPAGAANQVTVTALDAYGNVATGYTGAVTLTSGDPRAVLPASYTFTPADAGQSRFAVTLDTSGTQTISATDTSSLAGAESDIDVEPAAATSLHVTGFPTSDTAGATASVTVTAYDAYGNVATGYTGTVFLTSSDMHGVIPSTYTFTSSNAGAHRFSVVLDTAGTQSITATDTATASITGSESGIAVQPAAAKTLTIAGVPATVSAGTTNDVTVTAYDAYGNVATDYTGTVSLSTSDPHAALPSSYTFAAADAGLHRFAVALDTAGTQSITATDAATSSLSATESGITVQAAAAKAFTVTGFPVFDAAGTASNVTVTACDAFGNVATGYTGTVSLTSSDAQALLPSSFAFATADAGTHTFSIVLETAGSQSITATDTTTTNITGNESNITVRATPHVTWHAPATIVYGTPLGDAQLDASANVPGTFNYTPSAGTVMNAGSGQALAVTFTPQNPTYYTSALATTAITVTRAAPSLKLISSVPDISRQKRTSVRSTSVQLTAEITPLASGGRVPTGEVTFELVKKIRKKAKLTTLGSATVSNGNATVTLKADKVLRKAITIVYSGDANDEASALTTPRLT